MASRPEGHNRPDVGIADAAAARLRHPLTLTLLTLTFTTGLIDAASYLGLGRVFTANMTGNVVLLGFGLAGAAGLPVLSPLVSLDRSCRAPPLADYCPPEYESDTRRAFAQHSPSSSPYSLSPLPSQPRSTLGRGADVVADVFLATALSQKLGPTAPSLPIWCCVTGIVVTPASAGGPAGTSRGAVRVDQDCRSDPRNARRLLPTNH